MGQIIGDHISAQFPRLSVMGLAWCVLGMKWLDSDAHSNINVRPSHMRNRSSLGLVFSLLSVPCCSFFRARFKTEIWQAARDVSASHDVLLELFQRMEDFFKRFNVYSRSFLST
jgi:hypothetical protein